MLGDAQQMDVYYHTVLDGIVEFEIIINWCSEDNKCYDSLNPDLSYLDYIDDSASISSWTWDENQISSDWSVNYTANGTELGVRSIISGLSISANNPISLGCGILGKLDYIGNIHSVEGIFSEINNSDFPFIYDPCEECPGQLEAEYPINFTLNQNYPNPFNPITTIEFVLENNESVTLEIFDIKGRKINTLISGFYLSGSYNVKWYGVNDKGDNVPSGIYIYQLSTSKNILSNKMTLLR
tara:strand:- start:145 stop:864 length:720 start_codon:yes stop_codon:yes gene_type:complete